jgi:hypothetical protein
LTKQGYSHPTPIQAQAIPPIMAGRDLIGIAQTGTGKTAAFALAILHYLANYKRAAPRIGCRVLVLSPTRELASQIADSFRCLGAGLPLTTAVVFGGVPYGAQIKALARGLDLVALINELANAASNSSRSPKQSTRRRPWARSSSTSRPRSPSSKSSGNEPVPASHQRAPEDARAAGHANSMPAKARMQLGIFHNDRCRPFAIAPKLGMRENHEKNGQRGRRDVSHQGLSNA